MQENATPQEPPLAFNVVRQFVVSPDRHYRVELRRGLLHFNSTGTQFDFAHAGALNHGELSAEAPPSSSWSARLAQWGRSATRGKLLGAGVAVLLVSGLLIGVTLAAGWVIGYLYVGFLAGCILLMAGFVSPTAAQVASGSRNFTLPLARIQSATLQNPKEAGKAAHLELKPLSDKLIKLTIQSPEDLKTVREELLPVLGRKAKVA